MDLKLKRILLRIWISTCSAMVRFCALATEARCPGEPLWCHISALIRVVGICLNKWWSVRMYSPAHSVSRRRCLLRINFKLKATGQTWLLICLWHRLLLRDRAKHMWPKPFPALAFTASATFSFHHGYFTNIRKWWGSCHVAWLTTCWVFTATLIQSRIRISMPAEW